MISEDTVVKSNGSVVGTLKYINSFPEFNQSDENEQKGNYFPITLSETGSKMTLKKNGVAKEGKSNINFDKDLIFRVGSKTDKFTVEVITLNFENATLQTQ